MKPMTHPVLFLLLAAIGLLAGCAGSDTPKPKDPKYADAPEWYLSTPTDGAFYGVGEADNVTVSSTMRKTTADRRAMSDLATKVSVKVQNVFKSYQRNISGQGESPQFEELVQDVIRTITDQRLSGVQVTKRHPGEHIFFSLAKLDLATLKDQLRPTMKKVAEQVKANADEAFREMDRLLDDEAAREN